MIRHGSSFFFSLMFHVTLLIALFFTWKNIPSINKVDCEDKVCIQLCDMIVKKPLDKPTPKPKSKPKPIPKKINKPKVKPIPVVKKIEIVKEIPEVVPEEIKEEKTVEEKPLEVTQIVQDVTSEEDVIVEDTDAKQARLAEEYMQENIAKIIQLLQDNLYYPRRARKRGTTGEVTVRFKLSTNAVAHSIEVISSKSVILSRAAIKTIENLSGKFPKPNEELILYVPINYSLKN
ncbi:MAG: TonB family protein [Sulfurimonas sp.]|jgi:protein TonB|nr:TonB family protein [Sulfurimonas sp.]